MNQRKSNKLAWYSLGMAMLLCVALLVVGTGTALARYRAEREAEVTYKVRTPEQIVLGTISMEMPDPLTLEPETTETTAQTDSTGNTEPAEQAEPQPVEVFTPAAQLVWENKDGEIQLTFAVANGRTDKDYSARDQKVKLRMIGTLGNWLGKVTPELYLTLPMEEGSTKQEVVKAVATAFPEGSALQRTYGDGWLYVFLDGEGEELSWDLPGKTLSYISLTVSLRGEAPDTYLSLLQPQVIAEVIPEE